MGKLNGQHQGPNGVANVFYALMKRENGELMLDTREDCPSKLLRLTKEAVGTEPSEKCDDLVIVEYVDKTVRKQLKCYNCEKPFELSDLGKIVSEIGTKAPDKELQGKIVEILNKLRSKYYLDTCTRKAHFLAQIATETNLNIYGLVEPGRDENGEFSYSAQGLANTWPKQFSSTGKKGGRPNSEANQYVGKNNLKKLFNFKYGGRYGNKDGSDDGYNYRGRGLMQLTFRSGYKNMSDYMKSQKDFEEFLPSNFDLEENPELVGTDYAIATLTALSFWVQGKVYISANATFEDSVKVVRSITNGENIGIDKCIKLFGNAITVLDTNECVQLVNYKNKLNQYKRAPWMLVAMEEALKYKGLTEGQLPLNRQIKYGYFGYCGAEDLNPKTDGWCAAFAAWCLSRSGYGGGIKNTRSGNWWKNVKLREVDEPCYGAIIVIQNYDSKKEWSGGSGHISFVFGISTEGNILGLGGNQSNMIKISPYLPKGQLDEKYNNKIEAYYLPVDYKPRMEDELTEAEKAYKIGELGKLITPINGSDSTF